MVPVFSLPLSQKQPQLFYLGRNIFASLTYKAASGKTTPKKQLVPASSSCSIP
jgi:hypothetical protein